jgi:hypothetical protein
VTGRESIHFVRTADPLTVRRLAAAEDTPATLRRICRIAIEDLGAWNEILEAVGLQPVVRTHLIGRWAQPTTTRLPRGTRAARTTASGASGESIASG